MNKLLLDNWPTAKLGSLREAFGDFLVELAAKHKNLVVLTADLASSTKVVKFSHKFPSRFFQIGVAEQNMVGIAAGLAMTKKIPFCCSFASFLTGRAWEQIRICVALNNLSVKLIGSHAGLSHPTDGVTAQATEDISLMRCLPNMKVVYPADFNQMKKAVKEVFSCAGPVYLRMTRVATPIFIKKQAGFKIGQAQILRKGKDVSLISAGPLLHKVLLAAKSCYQQGIDCEVINLHTIKPIDRKQLLSSAKKTGCLVTIEDHQIKGGLGSAVAETITEGNPVYIKMLGLKSFSKSARSYQQLLVKYHLTAADIVVAVKKAVLKKDDLKKNRLL